MIDITERQSNKMAATKKVEKKFFRIGKSCIFALSKQEKELFEKLKKPM